MVLTVFVIGIGLSGCKSLYSDKYYTYFLQNKYSKNETESWYHKDEDEDESKIKLFSHNYRYYDLYFIIKETGEVLDGFTPDDDARYNYTEPYDLTVGIEAYFTNWIKDESKDTGRDNDIDLNKIIFNKLILHTKNKSIDMRQNFSTIAICNQDSNEDDILLFKNYGIIDLENLRQRDSDSINRRDRTDDGLLNYLPAIYDQKVLLRLFYKNIDIVYKNDRNFIIEFDITLEKDNNTVDNKIIKAKFNRGKRYEISDSEFSKFLLLRFLFLLPIFN
jgi:hypothetical protein